MPGRALLLLAPLLLAAGCATAPQPYNPVQHVAYSALGENPFWMVAIGDDRIVLRLGGENGAAAPEDLVWPRTLPRIVDGALIWESGEGTGVIAIESRPGPCAVVPPRSAALCGVSTGPSWSSIAPPCWHPWSTPSG